MFDMMKMMGKLKEVQENMKKAQSELKNITTSAESGAGMVTVKVNGAKEIIDLQIDKSIVNQEDSEMMRDLVIAAVNKAMADIEVSSKEYLRKATEGFMPNIPGMDLNNLV